MPFVPVNFAGIRPQGEPALRNLPQELAQGFMTAQLPQQTELQQKGEALANALKNIQRQYLPQKMQAAIDAANIANRYAPDIDAAKRDLLKAQAAKLKHSAKFGDYKPSGAVANAAYVYEQGKELGTDNPFYQAVHQALQNQRDQQTALMDYRKKRQAAYQFSLLPAAEKQRVISIAAGMGIDPSTASSLLTSGYTLQDIAKQKGVNLSDIKPSFPVSTATQTQVQQRQGFSAEISNLENNVNKPIEEMGRKILGFSPTQLWGAIRDKDPDKQGQILAARALQPELAAIRLKMAQGQAGIQAINEMKDAALGNLRIFESSVSPQARAAMNRYMTLWLQQAVNAYTQRILGEASLPGKPQFRQQTPITTGTPRSRPKRLTFNPKTGGFE